MGMNTVWLGVIFLPLPGLWVIFQGGLPAVHIDETINFPASDAATYFSPCENMYALVALEEGAGPFLLDPSIPFMRQVDSNMHWRYCSFTYFLFPPGGIAHFYERHRLPTV